MRRNRFPTAHREKACDRPAPARHQDFSFFRDNLLEATQGGPHLSNIERLHSMCHNTYSVTH